MPDVLTVVTEFGAAAVAVAVELGAAGTGRDQSEAAPRRRTPTRVGLATQILVQRRLLVPLQIRTYHMF